MSQQVELHWEYELMNQQIEFQLSLSNCTEQVLVTHKCVGKAPAAVNSSNSTCVDCIQGPRRGEDERFEFEQIQSSVALFKWEIPSSMIIHGEVSKIPLWETIFQLLHLIYAPTRSAKNRDVAAEMMQVDHGLSSLSYLQWFESVMPRSVLKLDESRARAPFGTIRDTSLTYERE